MEKKVKEGVKGMEVRGGGEMERGRRGKDVCLLSLQYTWLHI